MAPFEISYTTSIVSIALPCAIFVDIEQCCGPEGSVKSLKITPFDRSVIVTVALSCILSETKQDIGKKLQFFSYLSCIQCPRCIAMTFCTKKTKMMGLPY